MGVRVTAVLWLVTLGLTLKDQKISLFSLVERYQPITVINALTALMTVLGVFDIQKMKDTQLLVKVSCSPSPMAWPLLVYKSNMKCTECVLSCITNIDVCLWKTTFF